MVRHTNHCCNRLADDLCSCAYLYLKSQNMSSGTLLIHCGPILNWYCILFCFLSAICFYCNFQLQLFHRNDLIFLQEMSQRTPNIKLLLTVSLQRFSLNTQNFRHVAFSARFWITFSSINCYATKTTVRNSHYIFFYFRTIHIKERK